MMHKYELQQVTAQMHRSRQTPCASSNRQTVSAVALNNSPQCMQQTVSLMRFGSSLPLSLSSTATATLTDHQRGSLIVSQPPAGSLQTDA